MSTGVLCASTHMRIETAVILSDDVPGVLRIQPRGTIQKIPI